MNSKIPELNDELYTEQAAYLDAHTDLTEKEAEAFLRRQHSPDDEMGRVKQRDIASQMGVSESTYSIHLNNAQEKVQTDEATFRALTTLLSVTELGGVGGYNRQVVASVATVNAYVILTETDYYDAQRYNHAAKFKLHLVYREKDADIDMGDVPDEVIMYDKHSLFTIEADTPAQLVTSTVTYMESLSALSAHDVLSTLSLLEEHGCDVNAESDAVVARLKEEHGL